MNEQVIDRIKQVEKKLEAGTPMENDDLVFLFGLSLLKDKSDESE